jgi:hypothetical protein
MSFDIIQQWYFTDDLGELRFMRRTRQVIPDADPQRDWKWIFPRWNKRASCCATT